MAERLPIRKYVFTVEGETEQWYLNWLKDQINAYPERSYNAVFKVIVQRSPRRFCKQVVRKTTPMITHLCDVESNAPVHVETFQRILGEMKDAVDEKGIDYRLGYSNYSFELWMILHKTDSGGPLIHRSQYLNSINRVFGERFENLEQYKTEENFRRCLSKLNLADVKSAIGRAERIMAAKEQDKSMKKVSYKTFSYYRDNPALSVHETIKMILEECGI